MQVETYFTPKLEVTVFSADDIIVTSGGPGENEGDIDRS